MNCYNNKKRQATRAYPKEKVTPPDRPDSVITITDTKTGEETKKEKGRMKKH